MLKIKKVAFLCIVFFFCCATFIFQKSYINKGCTQPYSNIFPPKVIQKNKFNFIAIGDVGSDEQNQKKISQAIKKTCTQEKCDFVVLLGDNFYENGVKSIKDPLFIERFQNIYKEIQLPFFPILGNHDVKGDYHSQIYYSLIDPKWRMPNSFYSFSALNSEFIFLNSNCNASQWSQFNKLHKDTSSKNWTFVFSHHPLFSSGSHGDTDIFQRFVAHFFTPKIDFYISGHDHNLEFLSKNGTNYIISGSGGKQTSKKTISNDDSIGNSQFYYPNFGYVLFKIDNEKVSTLFYNANSDLIYEIEKQKTLKPQ